MLNWLMLPRMRAFQFMLIFSCEFHCYYTQFYTCLELLIIIVVLLAAYICCST